MILLLCLLKLQSFLLNARKKTPAFRTKLLNMIMTQAIPKDVIEHLRVRRRRGI